jgi:chorismate synthase
MKPISTTLTPRPSVDLATGEPAEARYERSDICAVPRAAVVGEAMAAYVLADAMLEKLGGDTLAELKARLAALPGNAAASFTLANAPWRFGYSSDQQGET